MVVWKQGLKIDNGKGGAPILAAKVVSSDPHFLSYDDFGRVQWIDGAQASVIPPAKDSGPFADFDVMTFKSREDRDLVADGTALPGRGTARVVVIYDRPTGETMLGYVGGAGGRLMWADRRDVIVATPKTRGQK